MVFIDSEVLADRQTDSQAGKGSITVTPFLSLFSPEAPAAGTLHALLWLLQLVLGRMAAAFHLAGAGSQAAPREHDCQALSDTRQYICQRCGNNTEVGV